MHLFSKHNILSVLITAAFVLAPGMNLIAQQQQADKIIAVIGKSKIILQSELDVQFAHAKADNPAVMSDSAIKCNLLQQMLFQKLMVEQAERDSVIVSDEEVDANMDNRLRYYIQNAGSKERLEELMGKSIYQIKEENREVIKDQLIADRMQGQILSGIKITPAEVKRFFDKIPIDSLPFFPATVEVGQIVVDPPVSPEMDNYARTRLEEIRKDIVNNGKSFETMAGLYSSDPSRDNGGDLGSISRTDVVPEFATATFKLQNGEISPIVKTKFGYHIIQMVQRQGEQAHVRHILIRPERTSADYKAALTKLDSIRAELISGKISFQLGVGKYSTDEASKNTGGMITNNRSNSTRLEIDELDPSLALMMDSMEIGGFSQPQIFTDPMTGEKSCRIVWLKSRTSPHKANLQEDYGKIQDVALRQKKNDKLNAWMLEKIPTYYIRIDPAYLSCPELAPWLPAVTKIENK